MGASEIVNISKNGDGIFEINIKVATDSVVMPYNYPWKFEFRHPETTHSTVN